MQRNIFFLFLFSLSLVSTATLAGSSKEISKEITQLKASGISDAEKWQITRKIQASGKDAIAPLIACVGDPSVIGKAPITGGECFNLPANLKTPPQCQSMQRPETLGERCELMLYNILTLAYTSPLMSQVTSKAAPPQPFVIPNWKSWWKKYEKQSLEEIQLEARKKIDEFWKNDHKASVVWE